MNTSITSSVGGLTSSEFQDSKFRVVMDETQQNAEGMSVYTTYKIFTETNDSKFRENTVTVWRRYSDFVWLHTKLKNSFKTSLVPPLPEKDYFGKNDEVVIEYRRRELYRFLMRVTSHHKLKHDQNLRTFLQSSDDDLLKAKNQKNEDESSFSFFGMLKISTGIVSVVEKDQWFREKDEYLFQLDNRFHWCKKVVYNLHSKNREYSLVLMDCCQKLLELKEIENSEDAQLGSYLFKYSDTTKNIAFQYNSEKHTRELADTLSDHNRMITAIRDLLSYRQQLLIDYESSNNDLQTKRNKGENIGPLEDQVRHKQEHFQKASDEIRTEIESYEQLKSIEVRTALIRVVESNLNHYNMLFEACQKAETDLNKD